MGKKPPHIALTRRSIRRKTITWALGSLVILANPSFSFVLVSAPVGHILTTLYLLRLCEAGTGDVTEMERILPPARAADPAILANPPHTATNIMSTNIVNKQNFSKKHFKIFS